MWRGLIDLEGAKFAMGAARLRLPRHRHIVFASPLGILGRIAEKLVLRRYLARLLMVRAAAIKEAAESLP